MCHMICNILVPCNAYARSVLSPSPTFLALENKGFLRGCSVSAACLPAMMATFSLPDEMYGHNCVSALAEEARWQSMSVVAACFPRALMIQWPRLQRVDATLWR